MREVRRREGVEGEDREGRRGGAERREGEGGGRWSGEKKGYEGKQRVLFIAPHSTWIQCDILWCGDGSLHSNFVPWLEGGYTSGLSPSYQLAVGIPYPVGTPLLLPIGLHIQVMKTIVVDLRCAWVCVHVNL